jgi:hypothetical protein
MIQHDTGDFGVEHPGFSNLPRNHQQCPTGADTNNIALLAIHVNVFTIITRNVTYPKPVYVTDSTPLYVITQQAVYIIGNVWEHVTSHPSFHATTFEHVTRHTSCHTTSHIANYFRNIHATSCVSSQMHTGGVLHNV